MKPEDVFGIIVRALGIWEVVTAAESVAAISAGLGVIFVMLVKGAIGGILLFNAEQIVRAAYRVLARDY